MSENRRPAGTTNGGQFAPGTHAEADVDLDGSDPDVRSLDRVRQTTLLERAHDVAASDLTDARRRLELCSASLLSRKVLEAWPDAAYVELDVDSFDNRVQLGLYELRDVEGSRIDTDDEDPRFDGDGYAAHLSPHGGWWSQFAVNGARFGSRCRYLDLRAAAAWSPEDDV